MPEVLEVSVARPGFRAATGVAIGLLASSLLRSGGFFAPENAVFAVALVVLAASNNESRKHVKWPWLVPGAAFVGVWIGLDAAHGSIDRALGLAAGVTAFAASYLIATGTSLRHLEAALVAIACAGSGASLVGWLLRIEPYALVFDDRFRLSGPTAYPNAIGLFAALGLVVAITASVWPPLRRAAVLLCAATTIGSLSRGAIVVAVIGVLLTRPAAKRPWVATAVIGGAVGAAGILTSASHSAQLSIAGLACGLTVVFALINDTVLRARTTQLFLVVGAVALGALVVTAPDIGSAAAGRFDSASTSDRVAEWESAFESGMDSPWTGHGPERDLAIHNFRGIAIARFAHNELLQVFAGGGAAATVPLVGFVIAFGVSLTRNRATSRGAAACALMFLVSGLIDFTWHFAALAAFAGMCAGQQTTKQRSFI